MSAYQNVGPAVHTASGRQGAARGRFVIAQLLELRRWLLRFPRCRIAADLGLQFLEIDEDVSLAS
jgi:hypothetical protein